jgi:hypothetical protein
MKERRASGTPVFTTVAGEQKLLEALPLQVSTGSEYDEAWLQGLIDSTPECLPIREIEPAFEGVVSVAREVPTPRGPIDNLLMTPSGGIVIVEAKLWRNPEARRKVVAQALDYAAALFAMNYETFEAAVLKGNHGARLKPQRLHDRFDGPDSLPEAAFVDAVSNNLRKGRALVLIVGDGIRAEAEALADLVSGRTSQQFALALVELKLYRLSGVDGVLVIPSTLAKTHHVVREVIDFRWEMRASPVTAPPSTSTGSTLPASPRVSSISEDEYFETIERLYPGATAILRAFIAQVESLGVYVEITKSLMFKWEPPDGRKPVNLGYIPRDGRFETDAVNWFLPHEISHAYLDDLAASLGAVVDRSHARGNWYLRVNGQKPRLNWLLPQLDLWQACIARLIDVLRAQPGSD